jgi:NSS family neurotransmitter:Na+ symporter
MGTDSSRATWATRVGFIVAAVGSAVGLGNIWRFPFQVGEGGGAAFLVIYLLFVGIIGFPAMLVEFTVGRRTKLNPVGALREFGGGAWRYVGAGFIVVAFLITSYYSVVAGWVLRYVLGSATGAYAGDATGYFGEIASGLDAVFFHALFMGAVVAIVAYGVQDGIERASKVMVPAIVFMIGGLAIYAATLPGAAEAYAYYLSPDLGTIANNWQSILPAAAGQAFFTLSLGMGAMITYASYLGEDRNLAEDGAIVVVLDTTIAVVTGLVVFPLLFSAGVQPGDPGPGAIFVSVASAFQGIPFGGLVGVAFFGTVAIAALSSAISLMEVTVAYLIDERGMDRAKTTIGIGVTMFALGIPTAMDTVVLSLYDILTNQILLVAGALLVMVLVTWLNRTSAVEELSKGIENMRSAGDIWIWLVRVPVVIVLVVSLVLGILGYAEFLRTDFAEFLAGIF